MSNSYYCALGTPLDGNGNVIADTLYRHVENQIHHRVGGLLVMGSMGIQPVVKNSEFSKVAQIAVEAAKQACPVYVGVMDNSVARVKERIASLRPLKFDGVVATAPFYFKPAQHEIVSFYTAIADDSPYPVYLYDLPSVTQVRIEPATVVRLMTHPNIRGIKTGDLMTARELVRRQPEIAPEFEIIYSGLDTFDVAYAYGIENNLDGMFSCTALLTERMYTALRDGNRELAAQCLDGIVGLRNLFVEVGVFSGFTHAMNLLGFDGCFHADYSTPVNPQQADNIRSYMQQIGIL